MKTLILGSTVVDVILRLPRLPRSQESCNIYHQELRLGGCAFNASEALRRFGADYTLFSPVGGGVYGDYVRRELGKLGVASPIPAPESENGCCYCFVEEGGERRFITNPQGSLRRFSLEDARAILNDDAFSECRMLCLASMFVSPELPLADMEALFAHARAAGKIVCADATRCKNGETLADAAGALSQLDYFFPNAEEARLLTGAQDDREAARLLNGAGAKNAVIKRGGAGCLIANAEGQIAVPAYRTNCVDTTGAGDTFSAAFQAALLEGRGIAECGAFACAAASICVENLSATGEKLDRNEIERRARAILNQM